MSYGGNSYVPSFSMFGSYFTFFHKYEVASSSSRLPFLSQKIR